MDSKEIKTMIKQSKEALKNKDFQNALKLCKAVLKIDRNNYYALVLLGAALQETEMRDQAPNAFRKAIEVSPNEMLAYLGLISYYQKFEGENNVEHLIPLYYRILHLENDSEKWCGITQKLEPLIIKTQNAEVLAAITNDFNSVNDAEKLEALQQLIKKCLADISIPAHLTTLFQKILCSAISHVNAGECRTYFNLLYKHKMYESLLQSAVEFSSRYLDDMFAREWMCKVFVEQFVENTTVMLRYKECMQEHTEILLRNAPGSTLGLMAVAVLHILDYNYEEARQVLKDCISLDRSLFYAPLLLGEVHFKFLNFVEAQRCAEAALKLSPSDTNALIILFKSLVHSDLEESCQNAVELAEKYFNDMKNINLINENLARAYLKLNRLDDFSRTIERLQGDPTFVATTDLLNAEYEHQKGVSNLVDSLIKLEEKYPDNAEILFKLALQYEKNKDFQNAHKMFLKCAKVIPYWYKTYLQLGYLYVQYTQDYEKARRCFQKAFHLAPDCEETGIALSDVYKKLGDVTNNLALLELVSNSMNAKWAWIRLGLQHLEVGNNNTAINCLRIVLRNDYNNSHLWETLADAYFSRGSYTSALKSYEKVAMLRPGAFYPRLQIATIKQITDSTEESLLEFRELTKDQPKSVLALKGLSETCLCLAKSFWERRLFGLCKDRLQEGLLAISSALSEREDVACLWKILGDIATLAGQLPKSQASLDIPEFLRSSDDPEVFSTINLFHLGARCYIRALKQVGDKNGSSFLWHDLAYNYRLQTLETKESQTICNKALACCKKSVELAPDRWQHWNLLGLIAVIPGIKNYALAQHAFIKAIQADDSTPEPWTNLGILYLILNRVKLANQVLNRAQRVEPLYRQSWIGQALIAETVNDEDTMDLYRHSTELGFHPESCLGYAQWVCSMLQNSEFKNNSRYIYAIENMHALSVAVDALVWATDLEEDNACGLNMLGCIYERWGQYINAAKALTRALQYVAIEHKDIVLANLARVLLKSNDMQGAINMSKSISKADFHSQCNLALALFKGDQLQESLATYESTLHWMVQDDLSRSHLMVAMAAVHYKLSGADKAKTLLFQCIQKKPSLSVYGLFAACALGMLNNDLMLSRAALKELEMEPYRDDPNYITHIAVFQAYVRYIQGQHVESVHSLSKTLHRQPNNASLWLNLALMLLQSQSVSAPTAARCAYSAMALGRNTIDVSKILAVVSLSHLMAGEYEKAFFASQNAVHLFPAVGESWAVLAASCHSRSEPSQIRRLLSHARQNLDLQRPLAKWMSNFERKIALIV